jgi:cytochrome P450
MGRDKQKVDLPGPRWPALAQAAAFYSRPIPFVRAMRRRYGPNFRIDLPPFGETAYVADPAAIKQVFTAGDAVHAGEANWILRPLLGDRSVLVLDGDDHLAQRRMLLPAFHGDAVRRYADLVDEIAAADVAHWPRREPFAVRHHTQAITLEVIMRAVIGLHDPERLARLRRTLIRLVDVRDLDVVMFLLWPGFARTRAARHIAPYSVRRKVDELLDEEIRDRRARGDGVDVLSLLVAARDENGAALTDQELRDEIITLLVAGHETTATALAWALERLSRHPDVLERLVAEIDAGETDEYLDAVCRETLRVRPVIQDVMRRIKRPIEVAGARIEPGAMAMPAIAVAHLEEDVYPDADSFRPERFLDNKPGTYTWLPFGGGTRRCIGASFALMEMKTVLAAVLRRVEVGTTSAPGERARIKHVTLVPDRGGRIAVRDRATTDPRVKLPRCFASSARSRQPSF